jgi:hypothetical protein
MVPPFMGKDRECDEALTHIAAQRLPFADALWLKNDLR